MEDIEVTVKEKTPANVWWSKLSINAKDSIKKTYFANIDFSVDIAYCVFGKTIK